MKLSSLATGIGFAELTYQTRQIESYNAHALEAFAVGSVLYLLLGLVMSLLFNAPAWWRAARQERALARMEVQDDR